MDTLVIILAGFSIINFVCVIILAIISILILLISFKKREQIQKDQSNSRFSKSVSISYGIQLELWEIFDNAFELNFKYVPLAFLTFLLYSFFFFLFLTFGVFALASNSDTKFLISGILFLVALSSPINFFRMLKRSYTRKNNKNI